MSSKTKFLLITLFSYFGDVLAVMALPLILLRQSGNLFVASQFSVIAISAALLGARPAAILLRRTHPLKLIFFADLIGCLALLMLARQAYWISSAPRAYLALCFVCCLILNLPMFAKNQLLYQYFIDKDEMPSVSALQGKLIGFVFVLSLISVGVLFEAVGFAGVIVFDVLSYVPLLVMCWTNREAKPLGYESEKADSALPDPARSSARDRIAAAYYLFNGSTYFFATLRSHMLVAVLTTFYPVVSLARLCGAVAAGAVASLLLHRVTHGRISSTPLVSAFAMAGFTFLIGLLIALFRSEAALVATGFLLSEIGALSLQLQRQNQVELESFYPREKMATLAIVSGSIVSALLIPVMMAALVHFGAAVTFGVLAAVLALASAAVLRPAAAAAIALILLASAVRAEGFSYRAVMSDRPRLLPRLGANTMSEDERFVLNNIHCGLFRLDVNGEMRPELAASYGVEEDGTLYRFKIKRGVKDSAGAAIDPQYVYRSIRASLELSVLKNVWENPNSAIRGYREIVGFENCKPGSCDLPGLRLDGDEIVIRLKKRWPTFLELLARHMLPVYRSEGGPGGDAKPIGCGSYRVDDFGRDTMTLLPNSNALEREPGAPDRFTITFADPREAVKGFCAGRFNDLLFFAPTRKELREAGCRDDSFLWREVDTAGYWIINLGSRAMFKKPELFSRLAPALDPEEFRSIWNIGSRPQESTIPNVYGGPRAKALKSPPVVTARTPRAGKIIVRYIDGTPEPEKLAGAVEKWMARAKTDYQLIPTPFTEFCEDLSKGSSSVYIYGESPLSRLVNFLAPVFEMNAQHYKGGDLVRLKAAWKDFLGDEASPAVAELDKMFLESRRFAPLFVVRRPLVFLRGYYIRRHSEMGLANLSINEFKLGRP